MSWRWIGRSRDLTLRRQRTMGLSSHKKGTFFHNVYLKKISKFEIVQDEEIDKEAVLKVVKALEVLSDQTDKLKSIIEDTNPNRDDDLPILKYDDTSEYIAYGFDAEENMTTLEIFTDKWERYIKERGSKEQYKECLKEEYFYQSNRVPKAITSKFTIVEGEQGERRVKAYITVFYPTHKIEWEEKGQRFTWSQKPMSYDNLVVLGILSPLWIGALPDVKFYTNNLRESHGYNYTSKTLDCPLYIKDMDKVKYFMQTLMKDIYKFGEKDMHSFDEDPNQFTEYGEEIDEGLPKFKNYFFVPIQMTDPLTKPEDIIDWKYIDMIIELHEKGIYSKYPSLYETLTNTLQNDEEKFAEYLQNNIFIKGNKPHCLYANPELVMDLRKIDGDEFADRLKINVGSKKYATGYELIDSNKIGASTVKFFREYWMKQDYKKYMTSPVLICDQIKNPDTLKLKFLPVDLALKTKKKFYTESKPPGVSGRPIMSLFDMYPYFMDVEQWKHWCFMPILSTHFERWTYVAELIHSVGLYAEPTFIYWATNSSGTSSEINYEPLETYGDTILKFAASWISYEYFKNDPEAGENEIWERRNSFLTNKELYRLGIALNLRRYIRTLDEDVGRWVPPFVRMSLKCKKNVSYYVETKFTGKHLADWVEALIAAYMLSGGIKHALTFISKIGAVPLDKSGLLQQFPDDPKSIQIKDLDKFNIDIDANFKDLFNEYWKNHSTKQEIIDIFNSRVTLETTEPLGSAYKGLSSKFLPKFSTKICRVFTGQRVDIKRMEQGS
jgi:dsRNA-specific ribonuclease